MKNHLVKVYYQGPLLLMAAPSEGKTTLHNLDTVDSVASEPINACKPKGFYLAGIFSGLLTGIVGLPGPPVVAVLANSLPKEKFRATVAWYFIIE